MKRHPLYGLMAEFENEVFLLAAAHKARAAGYRRMDAFTPLPVHGLAEAVGFEKSRLPLIVFIGVRSIISTLSSFSLRLFSACA